MDNLKYLRFSEINLSDPFFDSLKQDYEEFPSWFLRKANERAYVFVFGTRRRNTRVYVSENRTPRR